jgi:mono/diheme cytochrome c family protein
MIRFALCLFSALALCQSADAGYPRYYTAPAYCPPTYGASHYYTAPTYSGWSYWTYPGTEYFYRVRYRWEGGQRYLEDDGSLYVRFWHNGAWCYNRHCAIAEYAAKPTIVLQPAANLAVLGNADYGFDPLKYATAKLYGPHVAGLLQQQPFPSPVDVASLLPPPATERPARQEAALKHATSASEALKLIAIGEQDNEKRETEARRQLALQANKMQAFERVLGKLTELTAVADQQATISANAHAAQIPVSDQALAQLIGTSCFACHGGNKTDGGIDFKLAASFDDKTWKRVYRAVLSGSMPKGGTPLTDEQTDLFEAAYDRSRKLASN